MLERLPLYAACVEALIQNGALTISSGMIAKKLELGAVQVRKELAMVSGAGKPRIGYDARQLLADIRAFLGESAPSEAVIIGAGRLGLALLGHTGFEESGVRICAAFDIRVSPSDEAGCRIYPLERFSSYCKEHPVEIGIITVPAGEAQAACDMMINAGIRAIWNFAPVTLCVPNGVAVVNEKLGVSLSQLRQHIH